MITVEKIDAYGFEAAIRGMRNPLASWDKSDSGYYLEEWDREVFGIGGRDMELMRKLFRCGSEHRKYMRQIYVSMDITAPLYWWKEFDTYKVGVTADSTSTMHTLHRRDLTLEDFSHDKLTLQSRVCLEYTVGVINHCRKLYVDTNDRVYWDQMIQLLPTSFNQLRTVTMNYENAVNMIHQRKHHKLTEWKEFVEVLRGLPYMKEITEGGNEGIEGVPGTDKED